MNAGLQIACAACGYAAEVPGLDPDLPEVVQCFSQRPQFIGEFTYGLDMESWKRHIDFAAKYKLGYLLLDAGWYGPEGSFSPDVYTGEWAKYVGHWNINSRAHPNGLKPLADAAHAVQGREDLHVAQDLGETAAQPAPLVEHAHLAIDLHPGDLLPAGGRGDGVDLRDVTNFVVRLEASPVLRPQDGGLAGPELEADLGAVVETPARRHPRLPAAHPRHPRRRRNRPRLGGDGPVLSGRT